MQLTNKEFTNFINTAMDEAIDSTKKNAVKDIYLTYADMGASEKNFDSKMDWEGFKLAAKELVDAARIEALDQIKKYAAKMDADTTWRKYQEDGDVEVFESMPDYFETGVFAGNDRVIRRCEKMLATDSDYTINL